MEAIYSSLAFKILEIAKPAAPRRVIIGIAGAPGSGKSTVASRVVEILNQQFCNTSKLHAVVVPTDGFHYTQAQLDNFANPREAYERRGAPWTYDVDAVLRLVHQLRASTGVSETERIDLFAPSFDHALKDPVENDITIPAATSIVIVEGNYVLFDAPKWRDVSTLLDFRIFVSLDSQQARRRIVRRHILSGIEPTIELAEARFENNDAINGDLIRLKALPCDMTVVSIAA